MATDATGTPSTLGIRKLATGDNPSIIGLNGAIDDIDTLIGARITKALVTTTGDTIYASGASTPARLAIGTTGQVLTVAGGLPSWATPGIAGMELIGTHTVTVAQASIDTSTVLGGVIPTTYKHLKVVMQGLCTHADTAINGGLRFNNDSAANYYDQRTYGTGSTTASDEAIAATSGRIGNFPGSTATVPLNSIEILIPNYNGTVFRKTWQSNSLHAHNITTSTIQKVQIGGAWNSTAAITRLAIFAVSGNLDVGTVFSLYGLA